MALKRTAKTTGKFDLTTTYSSHIAHSEYDTGVDKILKKD